MIKYQFLLRGFASLGVFSVLILGFENCAKPNSINPLDVNSAAATSGSSSTSDGPIVQAYASANTSVPQAVWTKVNFDSTDIDTNASFDKVDKRFQPSVPGYYRIHTELTFNMTASPGFTLYSAMYKNGVLWKQHSQLINFTAGFTQALSSDAMVYLNGTTDYIETYAYCNSGTGTVVGTPDSSWMSAQFVRGP